MRVMVIANPMARKGGCARAWPRLQRELRRRVGEFSVAFTARPGHGIDLARQAVADGFDTLVAVGGDGTVNEVVNGMMENGRLLRPELALCPVPAGTANELVAALGHGDDVDAIAAIRDGRTRQIDVIEANCLGLNGHGTVRRYGYVAASFGAAAEISYRTSTSRYLKKLGGRFSYYYVTLLVTLTYAYWQGGIGIDGAVPQPTTLYTGLVCNTENGGGGMKLAPGARPDDGVLDLVLFRDIARADIILQKPSWLYEGRHIEHHKVDLMRGRRMRIEGPASALVDVDGETVGRLPLDVTVLPGALTVRA